MRVLGIDFAPLNVPLERRLQTLAAFTWIFTVTILPSCLWTFTAYVIFFTNFYWLPLLYGVFYWWDYDTPRNGGRIIQAARNLPLWKYLNDYFPLTAVKTCDLPADRNYLFCFYPHGILSANAIVHISTNGSNFRQLYPQLTTYIATLNMNFNFPYVRDLFLSLGSISASKTSLQSILGSEKKGQVVALIVGGAQEALYAKPGSTKIVLKNRKGFVKVALRTGASIVPVYAFGENDIFQQFPNPPGSLLYKFQEAFKKITGVAPVAPIGRGLFQYNFGMIPQRRPIFTVFGEPIDLPLEKQPTEESVEKYHKLFIEKLTALFEEHKHKYIENAENVHLILD